MGQGFYNLGVGKELLHKIQKATIIKKKINVTTQKFRIFFTNRHPQENEKAGHIKPIMGSYSK